MRRNDSRKVLKSLSSIIKPLCLYKSKKQKQNYTHSKTPHFITYNCLGSELRCLRQQSLVLHGMTTQRRRGTCCVLRTKAAGQVCAAQTPQTHYMWDSALSFGHLYVQETLTTTIFCNLTCSYVSPQSKIQSR